MDGSTAALTLDGILQRGDLRSVFQPIVDLDTGKLFGFEALIRGPSGTGFEAPDRLFAVARAECRLTELDAVCQATAVATAEAHGITSPLTLFVNVEPEAAGLAPGTHIGDEQRGMVELTERTQTNDVAYLLLAVQSARARGWGIALDDVGADMRSLALMPLLRPDVIKLDLRLVQDQPSPEIAAIAGAVGSQAERTGATVLAEGIETREQADYARALGATVGQGYFFGRPVAEPERMAAVEVPLPIYTRAMPSAWRTPFELASAHRPVRRATTSLLAAITRELTHQAAMRTRNALLISSLPSAEPATIGAYEAQEQMAAELGFAARLAVGAPPEPAPGVLGIDLREDDPVSGTWNVIVISPHFASMLTAQQRPQPLAGEHEFDFVFTYDRNVIVECAQALMLRMADQPRP